MIPERNKLYMGVAGGNGNMSLILRSLLATDGINGAGRKVVGRG